MPLNVLVGSFNPKGYLEYADSCAVHFRKRDGY
jgi:hypothetical protein